MKKIRTYFLLLCFICFYLSLDNPINAQEAVAPNGKFATVNGLKLYYEETGKGMPLIYLHGFTRSASDWKSHMELSKYYRIIAIDLPDHGRSEYMDTTRVYSRTIRPITDRLSPCHGTELRSYDHAAYGDFEGRVDQKK